MFDEENHSSDESSSNREISSNDCIGLHDNVSHARTRRNAIDFSPMDLARSDTCDSLDCDKTESRSMDDDSYGSNSTLAEEKCDIEKCLSEDVSENFNNNSSRIIYETKTIPVCQTNCNEDSLLNEKTSNYLQEGNSDADISVHSAYKKQCCVDENCLNVSETGEETLAQNDLNANEISTFSLFKKSCQKLCNVSKNLSSKIVPSNVSLTYPNASNANRSITAKRLLPQLEYCFAYMHGGKDHSNAPIICLPHYPDLRLITDEDFQDVFLYLTSIASSNASEFGFVLVLDRRRDKWASLRGVLVRLASFFPGSLKMVLILRPAGFFQGTISDLGFRYHRDEFSMKVPITMLSTLDELYNFIRPEQLTQEFGGSFDYDHKIWMRNRVLLEDFSTHATDIGSTLNDFGIELAQTELPNDVASTQALMKSQQESKNVYKGKLDTLADAASGLKETILGLSVGSILPDSQSDLEIQILNEMISLVKSTESAFDQFWLKHNEKLKQCLQLRKFEQDYREARFKFTVFEQWFEHQSDGVGTSMSWLRSLVEETEHLKETFTVCRAECLELASEGQSLIKNHYAVDCIAPKCSELHQISSELTDAFKKRMEFLDQVQELLTSIDDLNTWCDRAMSLLAGQSMEKVPSVEGSKLILSKFNEFFDPDKMKSPIRIESIPFGLENCVQAVNNRHRDVEKLYEKCRKNLLKQIAKHDDRPVQKVEPSKKPEAVPNMSEDSKDFPEGKEKSSLPKIISKSSNNQSEVSVKLQHAMNELLSTERTYVEELKAIVEGYGYAIDDEQYVDLVPEKLIGNRTVLLGNMEDIYCFHEKIFLAELEDCQNEPDRVGLCFVKRKNDFSMYAKYCLNSSESEQLRAAVGEKHPFFIACQEKLGHRLSLGSYLLKPVQRITKYRLLLQQIAKYSSSYEAELQEAVQTMLNVLKSVNDSMHQAAIVGYQGDFTCLGQLVLQGPLQIEQKKVKGKNITRPRFNKVWQRHVFLYEKEMLLCKSQNIESNGGDHSASGGSQNSLSSTAAKTQRYLFKTSLKMNGAGITDNSKSDSCKFEIWYQAREDVYAFQAQNTQIKQDWLKEIRHVLASQPKMPPPKMTESLKSSKVKRSQSLSKKSRSSSSQPDRRQRIKSEKCDPRKAQGLTRSASMGKGKDKLLKKQTASELPKKDIVKSEDNLLFNDDSQGRMTKPKSASLSKISNETTGGDEEFANLATSNSQNNPYKCRFVVTKESDGVEEDVIVLKTGEIVVALESGKEGWVKIQVESSGEIGWAQTSCIRSVSDTSSFDSVSSFTST